MRTVNMHEAKTNLSRLVEDIENGSESEIAIARNGRVVARLVPVERSPIGNRIGIARGQFVLPESIDALNKEIEESFT
jgi:antitoxin (DNA-binding transcriptional repressor) of toxin-antitoxin stability system